SGAPADGADVVSLGTVGPRPGDSDKLRRRRQATSQPLGFVSAAGPGGSWRSRSLTKPGAPCGGVAASWRPHTPGDRVKTARRAARPLARRRRSGALTPVSGPA